MSIYPILKPGDPLRAVYAPENSLTVGAEVPRTPEEGISPINRAKSIIVSTLPGPMGHYLVAVAEMEVGHREVFPLHMMEFIQVMEGER